MNVNLRPDKINHNLEALGLPFSLKVGMMRCLQLRFSIFNWSSSPLQVNIDDLQFIFSPTIKFSSKDCTNDDSSSPYNQNNCHNIFTHNIKAIIPGRFIIISRLSSIKGSDQI